MVINVPADWRSCYLLTLSKQHRNPTKISKKITEMTEFSSDSLRMHPTAVQNCGFSHKQGGGGEKGIKLLLFFHLLLPFKEPNLDSS